MSLENAGKLWTPEETEALVKRYCSGLDPEEIAAAHGRSVSACVGKIASLGLLIAKNTGYHHVDPVAWVTFAEVREIDRRNRDENPD